MAIIATSGGLPPSPQSGNTLFTIGAQGQPIATTSTNNRKRSKGKPLRNGLTASGTSGTLTTGGGPGFTQLDQSILTLDARYDGIPTQADWDIYAGNIAGEWDLCANCMPDSGGKKLYRQYNLNRLQIGLPVVDVPIDNTEWCQSGFAQVAYVSVFPVPIPFVNWDIGGLATGTWIVGQFGLGRANPQVQIDTTWSGGTLFAGAGYDFVELCFQLAGFNWPPGPTDAWTASCCCFTPTGAPGLKLSLFEGLTFE